MKRSNRFLKPLAFAAIALGLAHLLVRAEAPPKVPRFSVEYMDKSVPPGDDFFHYAVGSWIKANPVPADKSRWGAFIELSERNWFLVHQILEGTVNSAVQENSPAQKVADFYRSAMDTNRLEQLGFKPIEADLARVNAVQSPAEILRLLADFHQHRVSACFNGGVSPDEKNSSVYSVYLVQGGLSLPDRDYYLADSFAKVREDYRAHLAKMLTLIGEDAASARAHADTVMEMETALAKASKPRADLRDPIANYHKFAVDDLVRQFPNTPLTIYFQALGIQNLSEVNVRQPEFFQALYALSGERPAGRLEGLSALALAERQRSLLAGRGGG